MKTSEGIDIAGSRWLKLCRYANAVIMILLVLWFLLIPAGTVIQNLADPNLRAPGIPKSAWKFHQALSRQYEAWANKRLKSQRAAELTTQDISGTEWPLFGSVFYLLATESLQEAWDKDAAPSAVAPKTYARGAIEAATQLVIDPTQANWVKIHWGTNYLKTENVFYRMLVISALTSHARLTGDKQYFPLLTDQVNSLAAELDASPHGWLDDYPGECYPGDVLTSVAMIHRADQVLGTDHAAFVARALRGFQDKALDRRGLVPYDGNAKAGLPTSIARGCGNSYVSLFAPGIWPEPARQWYERYVRYFWQESWTCAGFREFPNDLAGNNWYFDVDSGLVLGGYGCAACAFGVGAARANGHFEHAYPLTAEMLVTSWPLPNGTRLLPRLLSNAADAPLLGEAAILFNLTQMPVAGISVTTGGFLPKFVLIVLAVQIVFGLVFLLNPFRVLFGRKHQPTPSNAAGLKVQFWLWTSLLVVGLGCLLAGQAAVAILLFIFAQLFPRLRKPAKQ